MQKSVWHIWEKRLCASFPKCCKQVGTAAVWKTSSYFYKEFWLFFLDHRQSEIFQFWGGSDLQQMLFKRQRRTLKRVKNSMQTEFAKKTPELRWGNLTIPWEREPSSSTFQHLPWPMCRRNWKLSNLVRLPPFAWKATVTSMLMVLTGARGTVTCHPTGGGLARAGATWGSLFCPCNHKLWINIETSLKILRAMHPRGDK